MIAAALVLAAGEGTRMNSALPKVAHEILGVPLVRFVVDAAHAGGCDRVVVVTGHGAQAVEALIPSVQTARQDEQLGTGHAVMCAESALAGASGSLVVLSGDSPLIRPETIARLIDARETRNAAAVVLTAMLDDPSGYGRIVRDSAGGLLGIVEDKDLAPDQRSICEINTGTYCFDAAVLFEHLHRLENDNAQGEFYLTDMVRLLRAEALVVTDVVSAEPDETLGVNSRVQLAEAARIMQRRINRGHMLAGVTMTDPDLVWIAPSVVLGRDVVLEPMTFLLGSTQVADGCRIGPNSRITDSRVGEGSVIDSSWVQAADLGRDVLVGPYACLRPGAVLESHAEVGACGQVGAGTIPCDSDGERNGRTVIGDDEA
jgi:bifunctional UDP-N-acetylglucosamine pyrophosphorylase/glucosamine-1-phosphate N-acetyltransferase